MTIQATDPPWAVTAEKIQAAIQRIVELAQPRKIILFGSYVRGETNIHSDVDILVVVPDTVRDRRKESVRLQRALRDILMPMDILVVPESEWEAFKDAPGLIYREAWTTGKIVYGS
ncbi:MAG TPA: nucleotidyltransferase domain-containing protein [Bryobacteraceae bacterium]|nr:nucleotidyltransferase domain-containing protein [Bryobacteraceae bacterium]